MSLLESPQCQTAGVNVGVTLDAGVVYRLNCGHAGDWVAVYASVCVAAYHSCMYHGAVLLSEWLMFNALRVILLSPTRR